MTQSGVSLLVILIAAAWPQYFGTPIRPRPGTWDLALPALPVLSPYQVVTFESIVEQLRHPDPAVRRQAVRLLSEARYPEAAEPIAALITDPDADLQLEAMAAELRLFLVEPPPSRRRVALIFEQRGPVSAEAIFGQGPLALAGRVVPDAVFSALLDAARHPNARVGLEALYTLGALAPGRSSSSSWPDRAARELVLMLAHDTSAHRQAALRVMGRVFRPAPGRSVDQPMSEAVAAALKDRQREVRVAALETMGALRDARAVQALMERFASEGSGREGDAALGALAAIGDPSASAIFLAQLADGSADRRRLAIEGLARSGPPTVLDQIQQGLSRETDRRVALAAAFAAARLGNGPIDPILSAVLQERFTAQAFGYLAELVRVRQRALMSYLRDPEVRLRILLADAVAVSGEPQALPLVEALSKDADPAVAAAAARAVSWLQAQR